MSGFNGAGLFFFTYDWVNDAANGIPITASRMDAQFNDAVSGFDLCLTRDGQGIATANLPMGGFKHTGAAVAANAGDYLVYGQTAANFTDLTVATLTVTGNATVNNLFCGTTAFTVGLQDLSSAIVVSGTGSGANFIRFYHNTVVKAQVATDGSFIVNTTVPGGWNTSSAFESVTAAGSAVSGYATGTGTALLSRVDNTSASLAAFVYGAGTPAIVGTITTNGTTTTYGTSSDQRLKDNITDAAPSGAIIDALQVRAWDWKSDGSHEAYGFVAQEEFLVYPHGVVQGDDNPDMITSQWQRDDSKLVPLLVKELQMLRARVAVLEAK